MHTMLIHPNFPSQFGNLAMWLSRRPGDRVTFVTSTNPHCGPLPFEVITYRVGNAPIPTQFMCDHSLPTHLNHAKAIFDTMRLCNDVKPDVVVGHATYGTWLYLRALYDAKFVAYHEYLPPPPWTDDFNLRPDYPPDAEARAWNMTAHAMVSQHMLYAALAYTPTYFQYFTLPAKLRDDCRVIYDGCDTEIFRRVDARRPLQFHGLTIDEGRPVVTYLSRGMESFRGFDIFYRAARQIAEEMPETLFLVAGGTYHCYGHDRWHTDGLTFPDWCEQKYGPRPDNMIYLGTIPADELPLFFSLSNCHIYLTVPYVLSWSLVQAMACGAPLVVSDTAPLEEVMEHGIQCVKTPFYSHEMLAAAVLSMLRDTDAQAWCGNHAIARVRERYSCDVCIPEIIRMLES